MRVVVANPVRQYSHRTAFALQEGQMLERYLTPIWYDPRRFPYPLLRLLPQPMRGHALEQLEKRSFPRLDPAHVTTYPLWRGLMTAVTTARSRRTKTREDRMFRLYREFDAWVAGKLSRIPCDLFVGYEMAALLSFEACRRRGIACVLDLAGVHWRTQRRRLGTEAAPPGEAEVVKDQELAVADLILTPSTFAEASLREAGIEPARIARVPFGMDPETFRSKKRYRREGRFTVLYVGALTVRKGFADLLEAVARPRLPGVDLILVGGMDDGESLLEGFEGAYRHVPFTRHEDLVRLYQDADVFVLPSHEDSFGMVVVEAMACGTPVIVTETTGARDAVRDGLDGYVVAPRDVSALRARLSYLRDHPEAVEAMGRRAHEHAASWTWAVYGERLRGVLGVLRSHLQTREGRRA